MKRNTHSAKVSEAILYIESLKKKLEGAMPEVHRQVKVYEERLRSGTLKVLPKYSPLFSGR